MTVISSPPTTSRNPDYRTAVADLFAQAGFIADVGVAFVDCGPGWCTTRLDLSARHLQHTGVAHAGVVSTMADHTAGAAAMTLLDAGRVPVTVEFKIHLLHPARGTRLECRGDVLKPGGRIIVTESIVFAIDGVTRIAVAKLIGTMTPVTAA